MKIDVFNTFNSELETIWRKFETDGGCTPFQSYAWLSHWQNTVGCPLHSLRLQIVIIKAEKELLAIFPLCIQEIFGISVLKWLGGSHSDYMGPLINEKWKSIGTDFQNCWQKILQKLALFDVIHFQKQKKYLGLIRNPFVQSMSNYNNLIANHANLKKSWNEQYEISVKTKLRADSRRQRRRLMEFGELKFCVADDKITKGKIINKMMQQKSRRYRETCVWDMLSVPEHKDFYVGLSEINEDYIKIHCSALLVGKTMVATHVGLVDNSTFYYLMPAHEGGKWERYSPGRLLLEHLLEWSIENKLKIFDFTIGGEHYKKDWCDKQIPLYETLADVTFKGKLYILAQHVKQIIKVTPWMGEKVQKFNTWLRNLSALQKNK